MISVVFLLVGVCVVNAQSDTIPLVPTQHSALMNVFDGLGEARQESNKEKTKELSKNSHFFALCVRRVGCSTSSCPRFNATAPCPRNVDWLTCSSGNLTQL
jgi:hypothetical protein